MPLTKAEEGVNTGWMIISVGKQAEEADDINDTPESEDDFDTKGTRRASDTCVCVRDDELTYPTPDNMA